MFFFLVIDLYSMFGGLMRRFIKIIVISEVKILLKFIKFDFVDFSIYVFYFKIDLGFIVDKKIKELIVKFIVLEKRVF